MNKRVCQLVSLDEALVRCHLTQIAQQSLSYLVVEECVGSTNDEVMGLRNKISKLPEGSFVACVANQQSAGRGRNGRDWVSPANANIYMSTGFHMMGVDVQKINGLSLLAGVAIAKYLHRIGLSPQIKWPNDILIDEKKLAGVLIDSRISADSLYVVVGIGLNVDMPEEAASEIAQPWTDLCRVLSESNDKIDRNLLVAGLLDSIIVSFLEYAHAGFDSFVEDWKKYDLLSGREVVVVTQAGDQAGKVIGLEENFALRVVVNEVEQVFYAADVKLKL